MFRQKFRAFPSAYWENSSSFVLENSDKIVLPTSSLTALTQCASVSFPVLVKISVYDISQTTVLSEHFSYVVDFTAPEGLLYMSSWMLSQLGIDQTGKSIVDVSLPSKSDLHLKCPPAKYIGLQPQSMDIYKNNGDPAPMIAKYVSDNYSSLTLNDIITFHTPLQYQQKQQQQQTFELKVSVIQASVNHEYQQNQLLTKTIRLSNDLQENLNVIGLIAPPAMQPRANNNNNNNNKIDERKLPPDEEYISDSEEWEIISIEKVKSASLQSSFISVNNAEPNNNNSSNNSSESYETDSGDDDDDAPPSTHWNCTKCKNLNDINHKFCPKCGSANDAIMGNNNSNNNKNGRRRRRRRRNKKRGNKNKGLLLHPLEVLNPGKYDPCEERQTGWILKNISGRDLHMQAILEKIDGDSELLSSLITSKKIEINLKINEQMFVLLEVKAPAIPAKYHVFYQLVESHSKNRVCDVLKIPMDVKKAFSDSRESNIKNIMRMGFPDRQKVIFALKKWNWDECKATNWLVTH
jgi:hypothetical protein